MGLTITLREVDDEFGIVYLGSVFFVCINVKLLHDLVARFILVAFSLARDTSCAAGVAKTLSCCVLVKWQ